MSSCAHTNAQLFLQIHRAGCSAEELKLVRDAYLLAMQLYVGLFTGSGKPTLEHEIGTASLAHRHGGSFDMVAASLLHGAYIVGDFGHYRPQLTSSKRETVRRVVGPRAESYVHGLSLLRWDPERIAALADGAESLTELERNVVFLKLVEQLDHLLDYGAILFFRDAEKMKATLRAQRPHLCRLASRLGHAQLGAEIAEAVDLTLSAELPAVLLGLEFPGESPPLLAPRSFRKRPLLRLSQALIRRTLRLSGGIWRRRETRAAAAARAKAS